MAVVPLAQYQGARGDWCVSVGDWVAEEQVIAQPSGPTDLPLHAPIPGRIVGFRETLLPGGYTSESALIQMEGPFSRTGKPDSIQNWTEREIDALRARLDQAGLFVESGPLDDRVHLPSMESGLDALVLNGLQPEPYLTLSGYLQDKDPSGLIEGIRILQKIYRPLQTIWATDWDLGPPDLSSLEVSSEKVEVVSFPFRYPQAQRGLLLQSLGLKTVSGRPARALVLDASSILAIRDAVVFGRPQVEKTIIVSGNGIQNPGPYRVRVGTPLAHLIKEAGGLKPGVSKVLHGGPFRGSLVEDLASPILKSTQGIVVLTESEVNTGTERPCIRCGQCSTDCPVGLEPVNLYYSLLQNRRDQASDEGLNLCLECGICSFVCPSRIPLAAIFKQSKEAESAS